MRLLLLKQLVAFLASMGIFLPSHRALICPPGHGAHKVLVSCESVRI